MQVQTFEVISNDPSQGDNTPGELCSPEAVELITTLGLVGQQKLIATPADEDTPAVRIPYRLMSAGEMKVYELLMPKQTPIAEYADGAIPLRALQVAAHARDVLPDAELVIWHPPVGQDDPILTARLKSSRGYGYQHYILARWGEVLLPFAELAAKAKALWVEKKSLAAKKKLAEVQQLIANMELEADSFFAGEHTGATYL